MDAPPYDVIIIGGGFGGLAIGALLARRGHRVLLCEQSRALGGRARSTERDGFTLDYGIHVHRFGSAGPAAQVMQHLGQTIEWAGESSPPPSARSQVYFNGHLYPRPDSIGGYLTTAMLPLRDRLRLLLVLLRLLRAKPDDWYGHSWASFIRRTTRSPQVYKLCKLFSHGIIAPDPETADAGEVIWFVQHALKAPVVVAQPVGGARQVIQKLAQSIEEHGGEVRTGCKVDRILIEEGRVAGVWAGGETHRAQAVVYTPPVQELFRLLPDQALPRSFWEYAANLEPTAGLVYDFGLNVPVSELRGSVINLDGPLMMGAFPSNADPTLAPAGCQLATFLIIVPSDQAHSKVDMERAATRLRRWINTLYPDLFSHVEWERRLVVPVVDGVHLRVGQSWRERHPVASPHVQGLFFVGDTVGVPGCSGDIAFTAALEAERFVEEYINMTK